MNEINFEFEYFVCCAIVLLEAPCPSSIRGNDNFNFRPQIEIPILDLTSDARRTDCTVSFSEWAMTVCAFAAETRTSNKNIHQESIDQFSRSIRIPTPINFNYSITFRSTSFFSFFLHKAFLCTPLFWQGTLIFELKR